MNYDLLLDADEERPRKTLNSAERKSLILALRDDADTEEGTAENWRALAYELLDCADGEECYAKGYAQCLEKMEEAGLLKRKTNMPEVLRRRAASTREHYLTNEHL